MAGQRVGYVRVSTVEQNTERQLDGIELDRVFTDHISGATRNRPALDDLRRFVREGDTVVVHSMGLITVDGVAVAGASVAG